MVELVNILALEAREREFESLHLDKIQKFSQTGEFGTVFVGMNIGAVAL